MAKKPKNLYLTEREIGLLDRLSDKLEIPASRVVAKAIKLYGMELLDEKD